MSVQFHRRAPVATGWKNILSSGSYSPAVLALAIYTFLLLSRLPELFWFLAIVRPILVLAVVSVALAWALPGSPLRPILAASESRAALCLFALAAASVPTSVWPGESLRFVLFAFSKTILFFFLLLHCVRSSKHLRSLIWSFTGAHLALAFGVVFLSVQERARLTGTYDPNDLAFVLVCALPVAVMLMVVERGWRRYATVPFVFLALVAIIMTKSRGGLVTLVVVGVILLVKLPLRNPLLPVGLVIASLLVFALFAPQSYWDRMATIGWGNDETTSERARELGEAPPSAAKAYESSGLSVRWQVWQTGIRLMLENPIFGVGASNFLVAEGGETFAGVGMWKAAHNVYLQIGAELGVPALVVFLYLLYRSIKNCRTVIRVARGTPELQYYLWMAHGFEAAMYGYIIGGAALNHGYANILYYLVAMSTLLKWVTFRDLARVRKAEPGRDPAQNLAWWKVPR